MPRISARQELAEAGQVGGVGDVVPAYEARDGQSWECARQMECASHQEMDSWRAHRVSWRAHKTWTGWQALETWVGARA